MKRLEEVLESLGLRHDIQKEGDVTTRILLTLQVEDVEFEMVCMFYESIKAYSFMVQILRDFSGKYEFAREFAFRAVRDYRQFYPYGRVRIADEKDGHEGFLWIDAILPDEAITQFNVDTVIKCVSGVTLGVVSIFEDVVPEEKRAMFRPGYEHIKQAHTA